MLTLQKAKVKYTAEQPYNCVKVFKSLSDFALISSNSVFLERLLEVIRPAGSHLMMC